MKFILEVVVISSLIHITLVRNIWQNHEDISSFVASQDIYGCIDSAKRKLKGILSLGDQLISDLPSAYLEIYEFLQIAKVNTDREFLIDL